MLRAAILPLCAVLAALGCSQTPLPGTQLGTFKVTGQSKANTCGLGAPDPWVFDAQLSQDGSTLYWSFMDGRPLASGTVTPAGVATITDTTTGNVDETEASLGPCTLQRNDDLELTLGATSFTGTMTYGFTVTTGSDCTDQLTASGGSYDALPCTVTYSLTGSKQ
jgi:hypothetical protein